MMPNIFKPKEQTLHRYKVTRINADGSEEVYYIEELPHGTREVQDKPKKQLVQE